MHYQLGCACPMTRISKYVRQSLSIHYERNIWRSVPTSAVLCPVSFGQEEFKPEYFEPDAVKPCCCFRPVPDSRCAHVLRTNQLSHRARVIEVEILWHTPYMGDAVKWQLVPDLCSPFGSLLTCF